MERSKDLPFRLSLGIGKIIIPYDGADVTWSTGWSEGLVLIALICLDGADPVYLEGIVTVCLGGTVLVYLDGIVLQPGRAGFTLLQ